MNDASLERCAVPFCSVPWHKMGEGKLFLFHVKDPEPGHANTKTVWLCENCFESWDVTFDQDGKGVLSARQRKAASA